MYIYNTVQITFCIPFRLSDSRDDILTHNIFYAITISTLMMRGNYRFDCRVGVCETFCLYHVFRCSELARDNV